MIHTKPIAGLAVAVCLAAFAGCGKPHAPTLRVIEESQLKVKVKGGEEIAAPPAQAKPADPPKDKSS